MKPFMYIRLDFVFSRFEYNINKYMPAEPFYVTKGSYINNNGLHVFN